MSVSAALPQKEQLLALIDEQLRQAHVARATYRLQFHSGFTFQDARSLVPYLHRLGVSDVYASPYLKARTGSSHGYDVANPNTLNPEIGSEQDYREYVEALAARGMGQVLDTVPNHMGIGDVNNGWWQDVLENGPASVYADFFDIDWSPLTAETQDSDKVVLPILGDQYGRVLENGELKLVLEDGGLFVQYYESQLPLAPESYLPVLHAALAALPDATSDDSLRLAELIAGLSALPPRHLTDPAGRQERNRAKELNKSELVALCQQRPAVRQAIDAALQQLSGKPGEARSFDGLDDLLKRQSYRLAYWRVAAEEINYRRFFDINDLAALRVEDPAVFRATHALLLILIRLGAITGIRVDHPDGLRDPAEYFWRLQEASFVARFADLVRERLAPEADRAEVEKRLRELFDHVRRADPASPLLRATYVVAEKILASGEALPRDWVVHGTTGYEFLNQLNGIFVQRDSRSAFDTIYSRFTGLRTRYNDLANSTRKMVMLVSLPGEVNGLANRLKRLAGRNRRYRDFTLNALTFAVREMIACLPVYRSYIDPISGALSEDDRQVIDQAASEVKLRNPRTDPTLFDFIRLMLLGSEDWRADDESESERLAFVARFQQVCAPVMAKGVEDTAFYQYNRLVSLNEVGGDPAQFGLSLSAFHHLNGARQQSWPLSMLATSTHDSKRSEDVRVRIDALSEMPRQWRQAVNRWSRLNSRLKVSLAGRLAPDRNDEYLLYQTLVGAWPLGELDDQGFDEWRQRATNFMLKAVKEAKVNTSWINPNTAYEEAVGGFVSRVLDRSQPNGFLEDFLPFAGQVSQLGMFNSLSQTLLKVTSPGVPDIYQGNEVWDFSLVDPDNRRPVDYGTRDALLASIEHGCNAGRAALAEELLRTREDGRVKMYVTNRCLEARRDYPDLLVHGGYQPLRSEGRRAAHVCSFARPGSSGGAAIAVAPVLLGGLTRGAQELFGPELWGDTRLAIPNRLGRRFCNLLTGEEWSPDSTRGSRGLLPLRDLLGRFPVALLVTQP